MNKIKNFIPILLVVVISAVAFGGCSGPDDSDRFTRLLRMIPAEENVNIYFITINDYASAFEDVGISLAELDEQSTTFQELIELIKEKEINPTSIHLGEGSFITGWGAYAGENLIRDDHVGYNFSSIDAEIQAGIPPHIMTAAIGRYNPEDTRDALQNQDEWPDWAVAAYDSEEYRGVTIHTWGDGYQMNLTAMLVPPHIDMLGRAMPLAVADGYLYCCTGLDRVKAMIDAQEGKTESLADLPEYTDIVAKMSELGTHAIMLGHESLANGDQEESAAFAGPRLRKFITFGTASGSDEKGIFNAVVIYHENSEDAEANIALLKDRIDTALIGDRPWKEFVTETDIHVEGNLLVAKLYTLRSGLWSGIGYSDNPLLLHEK